MYLLQLIALFLLVPIVATLAIPMRRLSLRFVWLALLFVIYMLYPAASEHSSYNELGLAQFVTLILLISLAVSTVIKLVWRVARRRSVPMMPDAMGKSEPTTPSLDFPLIATGAFTGLAVIHAAVMLGASMQPAWGAPALIVGVSVGMLALWPLAMWFRAAASVRQFAASLGCSAAVVGVGVVLWISYSINSVVERAEAAAGDKPYCVQVQGGSAIYKAAARKLDFSPQTMRAACSQGMCFDHHAVLVIVDGASSSPFHWSYASKNFVPGVLNSAVSVVCQPGPHFARGLQFY